jgi:hypothetical protein
VELSRQQRELVSRATAAVAGLVLLYWAWGCISWGNAAWADSTTQDMMTGANTVRKQRGAAVVGILLIVPYLIGGTFGVLGLGLLWIAVKPHKHR